MEPYQKKVTKKHRKQKLRVLGRGKQKKGSAPFAENPPKERSKSAPPGAGGV
tara:strand:+ start:1368 stop:1523 length:156 start_codon:yes stop_codon:yes gene_type:complete